jgi:hypothetical protein
MKAIRIERVFDDPDAVRALVERHGPYRAMASYLPVSATRGEQASNAQALALPWFRGTWAAGGRPLVSGAEVILDNPRFREAASRLFDGAEVTPSTIAVNVNAPMPSGVVHVDIPSFRGATRDRHPIQLLQAMGSSGLFEAWRIIEAGAVVWFYEGRGGEYDYWPDGLAAPMRSEGAPLTNRALVADNDRMYHRIGWVGDPAPKIPSISAHAEIKHDTGAGWVISDGGREVQRYSDEQIRISILWKGGIRHAAGIEAGNITSPLTDERIVQIFQSDLISRGIATPGRTSSLSGQTLLSDQIWLDLVHSVYYAPVNLPD